MTTRDATIQIEEWRPDPADAAALARDLDMLAEVLRAVVYGGAGVSFFVPFPIEEARAFWSDKVWPGVRAGTRRVVVARCDGRIVGTVQIDLALPPNQAHRAEVAKLLVHPDARRRGVARAMMIALEEIALSAGRTLLTLDTVTGSNAEPLYRSLGYVTVGVIPGYARAALTADLESTTIMYKQF
jgi:GNAT superfamily N-acetyltransferase